MRRSTHLSRAILLMLSMAAASTAHAQGGPPFRTDEPDTPGNKQFEVNFGFIGDRNQATGGYQVPDFDVNYGLGDRLQLKYEIPIAIAEQRPLSATPGMPAQEGLVLGGLGESLLGIKWRYYEHKPGSPWLKGNFGTGLRALFSKGGAAPTQGEEGAGDLKAGAEKAPEKPPNLEFGTYPQLYLDNPTRSVPRGIVAAGPHFYLPVEVSFRVGPLRVNADTGYDFGNHALPQAWNRGGLVGHEFNDRTEVYMEFYDIQQTNRLPAGQGVGQFATGTAKQREMTLDVGGRQALNKTRTVNLLLMGGRALQKASVTNSQPRWIAYVGVQWLFGPKPAP